MDESKIDLLLADREGEPYADLENSSVDTDHVEKVDADQLDYNPVLQIIRNVLKIGPENLPVKDPDARERIMASSTRIAVNRGLFSLEFTRSIIKTAMKISGTGAKAIKITEKKAPEGYSEPQTRDSGWGIYASLVLNPDIEVLWSDNDQERVKLSHRTCDFDHILPVHSVKGDVEFLKEQVAKTLLDPQKAFPWRNPDSSVSRSYQLIENADQVKVVNLQEYLDNQGNQEIPSDSVVLIRSNSGWQGDTEKEFYTKLRNNQNRLIIVLREDDKEGDYLHIIAPHKRVDGLPVAHLAANLADKFKGIRQPVDNNQLFSMLTECDTRFNYGENNERGAVQSNVFSKEEIDNINELYDKFREAIPEDLRKLFKMQTFLQYLFNEASGYKQGSVLAFMQDIDIQLDQYRMPGTLAQFKNHIKKGNKLSIAAFCDLYDEESRKKGRLSARSNIRGILSKAIEQLQDPRERYEMAYLTASNFGTDDEPYAIAAGLSGQSMTSVLPEGLRLNAEISRYDESGRAICEKDETSIAGYGGPAKGIFQRGPAMTLSYSLNRESGRLENLVVRTKASWDKGENENKVVGNEQLEGIEVAFSDVV